MLSMQYTTKTMSNRNTGTLSTLPCCWVRWRFPTANDFGSEIIPASAKEFFIKVWINYLKYLIQTHEHYKQMMMGTFDTSVHLTTHDTYFCRLICLMIIGKTLVQSDHSLKQTLPLLHMYVLEHIYIIALNQLLSSKAHVLCLVLGKNCLREMLPNLSLSFTWQWFKFYNSSCFSATKV